MLHCAAKAELYNIDMTLGKRIKRARKRLDPHVTQQQIADVWEITPQAVSGWERDESIPENEKLPALARILKVPLAWLLEGTGDPPPPDDIGILIESLNPDEMATVRAVIESLQKRRGAA